MLYDYILANYEKDEPIFISELPGKSKSAIRQEIKKLVDTGKIIRLYNGVYYRSYKTILGTDGKISIEKFIDKKFLKSNGEVSGYIVGLGLANIYGFTTQNAANIEICSNEASTTQRNLNIDGRRIIIYSPVTTISEKNSGALQFLELMSTIDKYSEIKGEEFIKKVNNFVKLTKVDFKEVRQYIDLFPDKVYKNIYKGGLINELV